MNHRGFHIGIVTVVLLVALRLGLGCHFLYEGVWKIKHRDEFTAEPFLTQAKGPMAGVFYAMIPDIDGRHRLQAELQIEKGKDGVEEVKDQPLADRWTGIRQRFLRCYQPKAEEAAKKLENASEKVYNEHKEAAEKYLTDNLPDLQAHFAALKRFEDSFEKGKENSQNTAFQKERRWKEMQKLRGEVKVWLDELAGRETAYQQALQVLIDQDEQKDSFLAGSMNPFRWSRVEQINFAVTYGLTAIGVCLMLGFCTRLAALGGGTFMLFVVLTQPAWPGIYPLDPPMLGHALLINKDFIEMLALFVIASTAVGHWGGLDYFLYHGLINPCLSKTCCRGKKEG